MIARNVLIFAHHLVIVVLLYIVMPWPLHWTILLAVPGFAILLTALLGGSVALGMLCARFRDIGSAIVSGLQFVFFLTPIPLQSISFGRCWYFDRHVWLALGDRRCNDSPLGRFQSCTAPVTSVSS